MVVAISVTQLQANAAKEQTGIDAPVNQEYEKSEVVSVGNNTVNQHKDSSIGTKAIETGVNTQARTQNATTCGVITYPNSTITLNEPGFIHVVANGNASIYLYDSSDKLVDTNYAYSSCDYKASFYVGKGTYKIKIDSTYYYYYGISLKISKEIPVFMPTKSTTVTRYDSLSTTRAYYVKVKAKRNGVLIAKPTNRTMGFCLTNARKQELSTNNYYYTSENAVFGIKKGTTYYLKVTGYDVKYSLKFTSINEKSGSKKSKAVKLSKKNKLYYGTLFAGSNTADWYKIKLSSKSKLKIILKPQTSDGVKISFYGPDGKRWGDEKTITAYYNGIENPFQLYTTNWISKNYKLDAGTYYVKITRASKYSSGSYSIKWK